MIIPAAQFISSYLGPFILPSCGFASPPNLDLAAGDHFLFSKDTAIFSVRGGGAAGLVSKWPMTFFAAKGTKGSGGGGRSELRLSRDEQKFKELVREANKLFDELEKIDPQAMEMGTFGRKMENIDMDWGEADTKKNRQGVLSSMEELIWDIETALLRKIRKIRNPPGPGKGRKAKNVKNIFSALERSWHQEKMERLITLKKWVKYVVKPVSMQLMHIYAPKGCNKPKLKEEMVAAIGRGLYRELELLEKAGVVNPGSLAHGLHRVSWKEIMELLKRHKRYLVIRALYADDPFAKVEELGQRRNAGYEAGKKRLLQLKGEGRLEKEDIDGIARTIASRCVFCGKKGARDRKIGLDKQVQRAILMADRYKEAYDEFLKGMRERNMMWANNAISILALQGMEYKGEMIDCVKGQLDVIERARDAAADEFRKAGVVDEAFILEASRAIATRKTVFMTGEYETAARADALRAIHYGRLKTSTRKGKIISVPR